MGSHSVTCHPAELTFPPLPLPMLVLDLATPEGCKAEFTYGPGVAPRKFFIKKFDQNPAFRCVWGKKITVVDAKDN